MSSVWYEEYNLFIPKGWVFLLFVFCFFWQDKNLFDLIWWLISPEMPKPHIWFNYKEQTVLQKF